MANRNAPYGRLSNSSRRRRRRNTAIPLFIIILIVVAALCVMLVLELAGITDFFGKTEPYIVTGETIEVHMIDIGQGDSILVMTPAGNLLFDAGPGDRETERALKSYIDELGIERFEYVIFTHPDEDHIGGGDMILNTYSVGTVLMEPYTYDTVTTVYRELEEAIQSNNVQVKDPYLCETMNVGELHMKVLGPVKDYGDKNDNSIVMRLDFGESSFLMTGDAESKSEADILSMFGQKQLDCDVLKVGHHGSNSSTTDDFLTAVSPDIALISSKAGNSYGHPKPITISKLESAEATIYRTDTMGDIVLITDGTTITKKN